MHRKNQRSLSSSTQRHDIRNNFTPNHTAIRTDRPIKLLLFLVLIILLSVLSHTRNYIWLNEESLWINVIVHSPKKFRGYDFLENAYVRQNNLSMAMDTLNKAAAEILGSFMPYFERANIYRRLGKFDKAIQDYSRSIAIEPNFAAAYSNRGSTFAKGGMHKEAINDYEKAITVNPRFVGTYINRGNLYDILGFSGKAIEDYSRALAIDAKCDDAYYNRAITYIKLSKFDLAFADFSQACSLGYRDGCMKANELSLRLR